MPSKRSTKHGQKMLQPEDYLTIEDGLILGVYLDLKPEDFAGNESIGEEGASVLSKLPLSFRNDHKEDALIRCMTTGVKLHDLGQLSQNDHNGKPFRRVPDIHTHDADHALLEPLEQWVFIMICEKPPVENADWQHLAERCPPPLMHDLSDPVTEIMRSWMRLTHCGYM